MKTKTNKASEKKLMAALEAIAEKHLDFPTLKSRNFGSFDFKEVSVWGVEAALKAAYELGLAAGKAQTHNE